MRNASTALTAADTLRAATARPQVRPGTVQTVEYVKRDGTVSTLTGEVVEVVGTDDKEIVRFSTDKGFRSANMWRITKVM